MATFPLDGIAFEELMRAADGRLYASREGRPSERGTAVEERLSWAATLAHTVDMRMNAEHEHSRAVADFASDYADQNDKDHDALLAAIKSGRVEAVTGV